MRALRSRIRSALPDSRRAVSLAVLAGVTAAVAGSLGSAVAARVDGGFSSTAGAQFDFRQRCFYATSFPQFAAFLLLGFVLLVSAVGGSLLASIARGVSRLAASRCGLRPILHLPHPQKPVLTDARFALSNAVAVDDSPGGDEKGGAAAAAANSPQQHLWAGPSCYALVADPRFARFGAAEVRQLGGFGSASGGGGTPATALSRDARPSPRRSGGARRADSLAACVVFDSKAAAMAKRGGAPTEGGVTNEKIAEEEPPGGAK